MNDNDVLGAVRDAMAEVHMHTPVQELVASGRSRRRRRIAGTAASAALATGLALTLAIDSPQVNAPPVAAGNQVHVHLAAFSVDTNPDGTVTVKMTKQESLDPEIMQRTLAQAGIPAEITINKWCQPSDASQDLKADFQKVVGEEKQPDETSMMVITPSAMPPSTKLIIGMRTDGYQPDSPSPLAVLMRLVPDDAPLTCTTDVPPKPVSKPASKS
ncbi:hypothetical protein [Microbispora sp. ATCC PTA-5024]|uniref:hypothetical protein n=1 Tax=Microbispora sp. ATCC PTA-5024 TaxID=316330 RepID=UPI0003DDF11B|nr:hypothetical protein [Microbispora sp. ATCC PTA-5024]ETK34948.1 hypothetical protein MPTA5024_16725 [Microbispora sp. ATCC PTA-5024]